MRYTLTGNFQYDLGIFGLKMIFDFFKEDFKTDEKYFIEINKTPEELLELILLKLIFDKGINYFQDKVLEDAFKTKDADKERKKELDKLKDMIKTSEDFSIKKFSMDCAVKSKKLDKMIGQLSSAIFDNLIRLKMNMELGEFPEINKKNIEDTIWAKAVWLLNNILLNFQADTKVNGKDAFQKACEKLYPDTDNKKKCSFCNTHVGKPISRNTYFFAPAQLNAFWHNEPSIFICPYCLVVNFGITQSLTFFRNSNRNAVVIYRSNLEDLKNLNTTLQIKTVADIGDVTGYIIEHEKTVLKQRSVLDDLQVIEFFIDGKNPDLQFYILSHQSIQRLLKVEDILQNLYTKKRKRLWGSVKAKAGYRAINLSKEILFYLSNNQPLINLVYQYIGYVIRSEIFRQKIADGTMKKGKELIKGFFPDVFLFIVRMHIKIERGEFMEYLDYFKEYGQRLRGKVYHSLAEGKSMEKFPWNTFNNKIIALSNQFLNSSKGSFRHFMENFTRVIISYQVLLSSDALNILNEKNYKDVACIIALAMVSKLPNEKGEVQEKDETVEAEVSDDDKDDRDSLI